MKANVKNVAAVKGTIEYKGVKLALSFTSAKLLEALMDIDNAYKAFGESKNDNLADIVAFAKAIKNCTYTVFECGGIPPEKVAELFPDDDIADYAEFTNVLLSEFNKAMGTNK